MKHLAFYALLLLCTLYTATGFSQSSNKPRQFDHFPSIINCSEAELGRIFSTPASTDISLSFSNGFTFPGTITSNLVKYSNLQTAVIKSPFFNNSIFQVSKLVNADLSISYVGRIIHFDYSDGYELTRTAAGAYQFKKIETASVIQDCSHN